MRDNERKRVLRLRWPFGRPNAEAAMDALAAEVEKKEQAMD